jgi:nucleoside-diphosphate-sugar epimerase
VFVTEPLRDKRVLVTGATGFIGSHLVRRLVAHGADVHALTSSVSSVYPTRLLDLRSAITLHEGNLIDRSAMDALVERSRPSHVFHLGAYTHVGKSWRRVDECIQANVQGTVNLMQALDGTGYERFVYTGTSEIYGDIDVPFREDAVVNPISPYSVGKYAGERYCRMFHQGYGWPIVMVRPFNAYGPWQTPDRVIPEIIGRAVRGEELKMTQGKQTREFNFVEDLVDGFLLLGTTPGIDGELFNLGCGEEVSMRDLATTILDLMGNPIEPSFGALADRPTEIWRMFCDSSKARERLGWKPQHSLADGLQKTIDWYRAQHAADHTQFFSPPRGGEAP